MAVFVNNPGNLQTPNAIPHLMAAVRQFEQAPGSVGAVSTQMWLNDYMPFVGFQMEAGKGQELILNSTNKYYFLRTPYSKIPLIMQFAKNKIYIQFLYFFFQKIQFSPIPSFSHRRKMALPLNFATNTSLSSSHPRNTVFGATFYDWAPRSA